MHHFHFSNHAGRIGHHHISRRYGGRGPDRDSARYSRVESSPQILQARRDLKRALMAKRGSPPVEQQRIADILTRAAAEISAG